MVEEEHGAEDAATELNRKIGILKKAIADEHQIRFTYQAPSGAKTRIAGVPLGWKFIDDASEKWKSGSLCIGLGFRHSCDDDLFSISRMSELEIALDLYCDESPRPSSEVSGFRVAEMVTHTTFGRGRIVKFAGTDPSVRVTVDFEAHGQKVLVLKMAKLVKA